MVIAIIGILAAMVLVSLTSVRVKAKDARVKGELTQARTQLQMYLDSGGDSAAISCSPGGMPCEYLIDGTGSEKDKIGLLAKDVKTQLGSDTDGMTIVANPTGTYQIVSDLPSTLNNPTPTKHVVKSNGTVGVSPDLANHFTIANKEYLYIDPASPNFSNFQTGSVDFALTGWFYLDQMISGWPDERGIIGRYLPAEYLIDLIGASNSPQIRFYSGGQSTGGPNVSPGWHFFAAWRDNSAGIIHLKIDNNATDYNTIASAPTVGNAPLFVGAYGSNFPGSYSFNGSIDSVGFWKGTGVASLISSNVATLYNSGKGLTYRQLPANLKGSTLISWRDLDESSGPRYDSHSTNHLTPAGQVLVNPNLNNGGLNQDFAGWSIDYRGTGSRTIVNDQSLVRSGIGSAKVFAGTPINLNYAGLFRSISSLYSPPITAADVVGRRYKLSFSAKTDLTSSPVVTSSNNINYYDGNPTGLSDNWKYISYYFDATAGTSNYVGIYNINSAGANNNTNIYVDDITFEQTGNPSIAAGIGFN